MEHALNRHLQDKEVWEAKRKELEEKLRVLIQQKCEAEEGERRVLREQYVLRRKVQRIHRMRRSWRRREKPKALPQLRVQESSYILPDRVRLPQERLRGPVQQPSAQTSASSLQEELQEEVWEVVQYEVWEEVWEEVLKEVQDEVREDVREILEEVREEVRDEVPEEVREEVPEEVPEVVLEEVREEVWEEVVI